MDSSTPRWGPVSQVGGTPLCEMKWRWGQDIKCYTNASGKLNFNLSIFRNLLLILDLFGKLFQVSFKWYFLSKKGTRIEDNMRFWLRMSFDDIYSIMVAWKELQEKYAE